MLSANFESQKDFIKIYQDSQYFGSLCINDSFSYTPTYNSNILVGGKRN